MEHLGHHHFKLDDSFRLLELVCFSLFVFKDFFIWIARSFLLKGGDFSHHCLLLFFDGLVHKCDLLLVFLPVFCQVFPNCCLKEEACFDSSPPSLNEHDVDKNEAVVSIREVVKLAHRLGLLNLSSLQASVQILGFIL